MCVNNIKELFWFIFRFFLFILIFFICQGLSAAADKATINKEESEFTQKCLRLKRPISDKLVRINAPGKDFIFNFGEDDKSIKFSDSFKKRGTLVNINEDSESLKAMIVKGSSGLKLSYVRNAKASPLVSDASLRFESMIFEWNNEILEIFFIREIKKSRIVSAISKNSNNMGVVKYYWFPAAESDYDSRLRDMVALEHIYPRAFNELATKYFHFSVVKENSVQRHLSQKFISQNQLLERIAYERECLAVSDIDTRRNLSLKRWVSVKIENHSSDRNSVEVKVRLLNKQNPISSELIFFRKEPHMECVAKSNLDGFASCNLEDTHGHDHHHEDAESIIVATFPGKIGPASILLPTAEIISYSNKLN